MAAHFYWRLGISVLVALLLLGGAWWWLQQPVGYTGLSILSPQDTQHQLPVFAQFTVTQTAQLQAPLTVTALEVPLYLPSPTRPLRIVLWRNGVVVYAWQTPVNVSGLTILHLPLPEPTRLDGSLAVLFDGQNIAYADQAQAPRIFFESAGNAFPDGSYRIADNEKTGDIGLTFLATTTHQQQFMQSWQNNPAGMGAHVVLGLVMLWWLLLLPFVLASDEKSGALQFFRWRVD